MYVVRRNHVEPPYELCFLVCQFGDTPFSKAAGRGYKEIMDFLISKGVVAGGLDEVDVEHLFNNTVFATSFN